MFTSRFPELSMRIREYISSFNDIKQIRCCVPGWKVKFYEDAMPEGKLRDSWLAMPHTADFSDGDCVYSLCSNCSNIIEECNPGVNVHSLWELIDNDSTFHLPDYSGMKVTIQDCWRSRDRSEVQNSVRSLLTKMNIEYVEAQKNHAETDFCGVTLYKPQIARNPALAPKHYKYGTEGLFLPHTEEEQRQIMKDYCSNYKTDTVVCYCHYCLEGLQIGGVNGIHIANLLFPEK